MRIGLVVSPLVGLVLWSSLSLGCKDKGPPPKATREECAKVAEHIADLIIEHYAAAPDDWWESIHTVSALETGIPKDVQKVGFKEWLRTPEGETWKLLRRGQTLAGTQQGIDGCVATATKPYAQCLLDAKSKADVTKCDEKFGGASPLPKLPTAGSGSAAGSGM
jgi:hypothetical protein